MALPPVTFVVLWLIVAVAFLFFGAIAVGMTLLLGYLAYQVVAGGD